MSAESSDQELRQRLRQLEASEVRLRVELAASADREAALASISHRINEQPLDVDGTLLAIAEAAREMTGGDGARVWLRDGDRLMPKIGAIGDSRAAYVSGFDVDSANEDTPAVRCVRERGTVAIADILEQAQPGPVRDYIVTAGIRSNMAAPLGRGDSIAGSLAVMRTEVRPFNSTEIATLEAFAAQAAIAIETARAQQTLAAHNRALAEGLERETATAEILDVISRSPANLQAALDVVVLKATQLLESDGAVVIRFAPDGSAGWVAVANGTEISPDSRLASPTPTPADAGSGALAILGSGRTVMRHGGPESLLPDAPQLAAAWRARGVNSSIVTPLTTTRGRFGALVVTRSSPEPYTDAQIGLLETFADQAVIAIENARLFDELQDSNADLAASVEREAALARISQRINEQPLDVDGALLAIAEAARALTDSDGSRVCLVDGDDVVGYQMSSRIPELAEYYAGGFLRRMSLNDARAIHVRAIRDRRSIAVDDGLAMARQHGIERQGYQHNLRSMMAAPITREGAVLGSLYTVRTEVRPYVAGEIASLEAFASQAATAIETARAQRELAERNREVTEALETQTVMADVLGIIAASPADLDAVLPQLAGAAARLCDADSVVVAHGKRIWATGVGHTSMPAIRSRPRGARCPSGRYATRRCGLPDRSTRGRMTIRTWLRWRGPTDNRRPRRLPFRCAVTRVRSEPS